MRLSLGAELLVLLAIGGLPVLPAPVLLSAPGGCARAADSQPSTIGEAAPHRAPRGRLSEADGSGAVVQAHPRSSPDALPVPSPAPRLLVAELTPCRPARSRPGLRHPGPAAPARAPPLLSPS